MVESAFESAAKALEKAIESLNARLDGLSSWQHFWVFLVVVGVALETVLLINEYCHDRRLYLRGTISSPAKPLIRDLVLSLLGAGLVAIGVAGELGVDFKASVVESQLRNKH